MKGLIKSIRHVLCIGLVSFVAACQFSTKMYLDKLTVNNEQSDIAIPIQESVKAQPKCKIILLHDVGQSNDVFHYFASELKEELAKLGIYNIEFLYPIFREKSYSISIKLTDQEKRLSDYINYVDKHCKPDEIIYILGCGQGALLGLSALRKKRNKSKLLGNIKEIDILYNKRFRFISLNGWLNGLSLVSKESSLDYKIKVKRLIEEFEKIGGEGF